MEPPTRIRRTIRACLQCRTRKQRCDGPYTVPCQRCKSAGRECSFEAEAVPESPRFHPYSGDRNFSPHALAEVQRELTDTKRRLEIVETKLGIVPTKTPKYEDDVPTSETLSVDISPQSWQDVNSPPSAVQDPPPRAESPPRKTVNSIALAAPMATLRNLASHPEDNNQSSMRRTSTPEPSNELPPSVISSFDPIKRGVITLEEANKLFTIYFENNYPLAPFLCARTQRNAMHVRSTSVLLFISVCCIGARYWNYENVSSPQSWLHPKYSELVSLLDNCISALLLRPSPTDINLEAVQSMLLYVQWMPLQVPEPSTGQLPRSRFSDASAWTIMGVAIRFSTYLNLDRSVLLPFSSRDVNISDADMRTMRVWLNLVSVDYYLTLTAALPVQTDPIEAAKAARAFGSHPCSQPGDIRLAGLTELVAILHEAAKSCGDFTLRSIDEKSLRRCNDRLNEWESTWGAMMCQPQDRRAQQTPHDQAAYPTQMPLTAVRFYRMAINSIHLGTTMTRWLTTSGPPPISLAPSLEAAANMIFYLSAEAETGFPPNAIMRATPPRQFSINASAMVMLRFAIDPYWACHAFAAVFLALLYDRGAIDDDLNIRDWHGRPTAPPRQMSLLLRLERLAADIFDTICGPSIIHPAAHYRKIVQNVVQCLTSNSYNPEGESYATGSSDVEGIFTSLLDGGFDWTVFRDAAAFQNHHHSNGQLQGFSVSHGPLSHPQTPLLHLVAQPTQWQNSRP